MRPDCQRSGGARVIGLALVNLWQTLDTADGSLARATGRTSPYGAFLNRLGYYLVTLLLPVAIGLGLYLRPEPSLESLINRFGWSVHEWLVPVLPLVFGAFASGAKMVRLLTVFAFAQVRRRAATASAGEAPRGRRWLGLALWMWRNFLELPGFLLPLLVALAVAGWLSVGQLVYAMCVVLEVAILVSVSFWRLLRAQASASWATKSE